ncbi:Crp/Fnr family transcriptional regulator [Lacrimispora sphenoides]|uniref:cAMP-binding domain of CRP or a regulatory subunit of cAMP-dependent protein kinases n=1 Tax=Lacrimispora sphenoides JCM 1415 TaxID=1297793 RepID=A0ABY1CCZ6_9FIRM|nr:Crp/Fnr family transcriptional regulator [Lacrimispora sphenoides]SET92515.1 cAMP-binding domain of CRP or a regulatory subunit of cAMP-dependent protein kinases [[Clostridium] sphenoides JCM 1415]SUY52397.1 CRP (cyclic AMP receptor protein) regulatory protein [Lacrimispora sphenoides]
MDLKKEWEKYEKEIEFNYSVLPDEMKSRGELITYAPKQFIVSQGEFPQYIYFIKEGIALGTRNYSDGNEYNYFQIDKNNGSIGLLELFARKDAYVATIISMTEVKAVRMESAAIYAYVMNHIDMLRRCLALVSDDLYKRSGNDGIFYYLDGLDRVRYYLVNYYDAHKKETTDTVTVEAEYQDIANSVGISLRTVGRSLRKLKDREEINSIRKKLIITKEKYDILFDNLWIR